MTPAKTRDNHYARLNDYRRTREYQDYAREIGIDVPGDNLPSLLGQRWEIDEAIYDEFLNMIPPLYWRGGSFYCREECFGGLYAKFTQEGDRYFCEYARLPKRLLPGMQP